MGTNKRYSARYDRMMDDRIAEAVAAKGGLQCLKPEELALDSLPLTIDPNPKPVLAWVRFFDSPLRVRAVAERWTSRAVGVRFEIRGKVYKTWVWSDAVDIDPAPRGGVASPG